MTHAAILKVQEFHDDMPRGTDLSPAQQDTFSAGSPAHYGSLSYEGHPAEPAEIEFVKVEINTTDKDSKTAKAENYFPAPDWLCTILHNDDDIYQEICSQDHTYYPEYEYEGD